MGTKDSSSSSDSEKESASFQMEIENPISSNGDRNILERVSDMVDGTLSKGFYQLGLFNGKHPFLVLFLAVIFVAACGSGFTQFYQESRVQKLWIPQDTVAIESSSKVEANFPSSIRINYYIISDKEDEGANILSLNYLSELLYLHEQTKEIKTETEGNVWDFESLCEKRGPNCFVSSILEVWDYNRTLLENETDILGKINNYYDSLEAIEAVLGDVTVENDLVVKAAAMRTIFFNANRARVENGRETDPPAENWEIDWIDFMLEQQTNTSLNVNIYFQAAQSFGQVFGGAIQGDIVFLSSSYFLIIIYAAIMLSSWGKGVHLEIGLTLAGILGIGFSIVISIGFSSWLDQFYGSVHSVLPFVLLGIGVDDMFVIVDAFRQTDQSLDVTTRMAVALSHAGVSITVTSVTDFVAFSIGASTSLPALSTFCVYAAVGIFGIFVLQITWFSACVVLDARRQNTKRIDCCCCCPLKGDIPERASYSPVSKFLEKFYTPFILKPYFKFPVIIFSVILVGTCCYLATLLEEDASFINLVPTDSYLRTSVTKAEDFFPSAGQSCTIYTEEFDYFVQQKEISNLREVVKDVSYIRDVYGATWESWYDSYIDWLGEIRSGHSTELSSDGTPETEENFYNWLQEYLNGEGGRFRNSIVFKEGTNNTIIASRIETEFEPLSDGAKQVEGMDSIMEALKTSKIPCFAYTFAFLNYETIRVIEAELITNIVLTLVMVFLITLILIAHPITSLAVCSCVVMTVVELLGLMYVWDVPIDAVSVVNLVLAVGLAVDYSAHIGHGFMTAQGDSREERVILAMRNIGGSVLNGAISTFLAVVLLSVSSSYVFIVFFKQFFGIIIFGVYNGMVLLPIILSLIGPSANLSAIKH